MRFKPSEHIQSHREHNDEHGYTELYSMIKVMNKSIAWDAQIETANDPEGLLQHNEKAAREELIDFLYGDILSTLPKAAIILRITGNEETAQELEAITLRITQG